VNIHEPPGVPRSQCSAPVSTHPDATGTASDRVKVSKPETIRPAVAAREHGP
jgi:hypothetical protein